MSFPPATPPPPTHPPPPNGAWPILEQTSLTCCYSECCLKLLLPLSVKISAIIRRLPALRIQTAPFPQTDVYVAWNRATEGIAFAQNVFFLRHLDAAAAHSSAFDSRSCVVGEDTEETRGVNLAVCQPCIRITRFNPSYLPGTLGEQDTHPFRARVFLGGFFSHYYLFIYFMTSNVINLRMLWSGVSQRGFIQHSSPER